MFLFVLPEEDEQAGQAALRSPGFRVGHQWDPGAFRISFNIHEESLRGKSHLHHDAQMSSPGICTFPEWLLGVQRVKRSKWLQVVAFPRLN